MYTIDTQNGSLIDFMLFRVTGRALASLNDRANRPSTVGCRPDRRLMRVLFIIR